MYNLDELIYNTLVSLDIGEVVNGYPTRFEDKDLPIISFTLDGLYDEVKNIQKNTSMYRNNYTVDIFTTSDENICLISTSLEDLGLTLTGYNVLPTEKANINHYILHFTALVQEYK